MAQPLEASMPQFMNLPDGYRIRWTAVNPTTGAPVAAVSLEEVSIFAQYLGGLSPDQIPDTLTGPWQLVYTNLG